MPTIRRFVRPLAVVPYPITFDLFPEERARHMHPEGTAQKQKSATQRGAVYFRRSSAHNEAIPLPFPRISMTSRRLECSRPTTGRWNEPSRPTPCAITTKTTKSSVDRLQCAKVGVRQFRKGPLTPRHRGPPDGVPPAESGVAAQLFLQVPGLALTCGSRQAYSFIAT
jgi:hypothetical protein